MEAGSAGDQAAPTHQEVADALARAVKANAEEAQKEATKSGTTAEQHANATKALAEAYRAWTK